MSEAPTSDKPTEEQPAPKRSGGFLALAAVAAVTLLAGGGVGAFVVGPKLVGGATAGETAGEAEAHDGGGEHGEATSGSTLYTVDNLVVNPAATEGTRFLILTLAAETSSESVVERLQQHDAEIRDVLHGVLASKTVDVLADVGQREELKAEIAAAINAVIRPDSVQRIFLPQFVLQ